MYCFHLRAIKPALVDADACFSVVPVQFAGCNFKFMSNVNQH